MLKTVTMIALSILVLTGLGFLFATSIGRPVSTDLSLIGKGKPTLVLAYENYSPTSADALSRLGQVRDEYESRLDFVVADLGVPQGKAFADRHALASAQAVFLMPDGTPLQTMSIPADAQTLRRLLDEKLARLR